MAKRAHRRTNPASFAEIGGSTKAAVRRGRLRLPIGASDEAARASALRSLEVAKVLAFERDDLTGALDAIEQQARILGLFRPSNDYDLPRLADEALIAAIAGEDEALAATLRALLKQHDPART